MSIFVTCKVWFYPGDLKFIFQWQKWSCNTFPNSIYITWCNLFEINFFTPLNLLSSSILFPRFCLFLVGKVSFLWITLSLNYEKLWRFLVKKPPLWWMLVTTYDVEFTRWKTFICSLNSSFTNFSLKLIACPGSHASRVTINRWLTKYLPVYLGETDPILFTCVLGNKRSNTDKKLSPVLLKHVLGRRKIKRKNGSCKAFCVTRKRNKLKVTYSYTYLCLNLTSLLCWFDS